MNATEQDKILPSSMLVREHIEANLSAFEIQHENGLHGREFLEVFGNSGHYTYPVIKERKEYCYLCEENAADELNAQALEDFASCAEPAFPALRTDGRANPLSPEFDPFFVATGTFSECAEDDLPAQREQEDHNYLIALGHLNNVEGIRNVFAVATFVGACYSKSAEQVIWDASMLVTA